MCGMFRLEREISRTHCKPPALLETTLNGHCQEKRSLNNLTKKKLCPPIFTTRLLVTSRENAY